MSRILQRLWPSAGLPTDSVLGHPHFLHGDGTVLVEVPRDLLACPQLGLNEADELALLGLAKHFLLTEADEVLVLSRRIAQTPPILLRVLASLEWLVLLPRVFVFPVFSPLPLVIDEHTTQGTDPE